MTSDDRASLKLDPWWGLSVFGVVALAAGLLLLTIWEVPVFRFTTFERDFSGLECGVPLDNPGWVTGSPCHGAVNRQTAVGWMLTLLGFASLIAAVAMGVGKRAGRSAGPAD